MKAIIQGIPTNLKVTSAVLESDPENPEIFILYHCWRCGNRLLQFSGNVLMLLPGAVPATVPIVLLCKVCKTRHLINSIM